MSCKTNGSNSVETVDKHELFRCLSDIQRTKLLSYLIEDADGSTTTVEEVKAYLAEGSDRSSEEITIALLHLHLPKLADANVIEHDRDTGTVHLSLTEEERNWLTQML